MRTASALILTFACLAFSAQANSQPAMAAQPVPVEGPAARGAADKAAVLPQTPGRLEQLEARLSAAEAALKDASSKTAPAYWAAIGVVVASLLAGAVAIWNHRVSAKEGQLLRAIELIMGSRNAHEARLRMLNLDPFLTPSIKAHWESMLPKLSDEPERRLRQQLFSGSEWTELRLKVAESMVESPEHAAEILAIWKAVMKDKTAVTGIDWSSAEAPAARPRRLRPRST